MKNEALELRNALRGLLDKYGKQVLLVSMALNVLILAPSLYMMQVYDRVMTSRSLPTLLALTFMLLVVFATWGALDFLRAKAIARIGAEFDQNISPKVFDYAFRRAAYSGVSAGGWRAQDDVTAIRSALSGPTLISVLDAPWTLLFMLVCFMLHPWLGWFAVLGATIQISVALASEMASRKHTMAAINNAREVFDVATQHAQDVMALGMSNSVKARWATEQTHERTQSRIFHETNAKYSSFSRTLRMAWTSMTLGLGAWLAMEGEMTGGAMLAVSVLSSRALQPLEQLISSSKSLMAAFAAVRRLETLAEAWKADKPGLKPLKLLGKLEAENVSVSYGNKLALRGCNFSIGPGDVLLVVGYSGSGKTTLLKALTGIIKPSAGIIRYDGADISGWEELGSKIGYVPNSPKLMPGTVAQNIARFDADASPQAVLEAAVMANVHDSILRLPSGYETDATTLSAGQAQRVAIARAVYGNASVLLLDEPNSHLDNIGETILYRTVKKLSECGVTVVMTTHKMGAVDVANKLLVLKDGVMQAFGKKELLITAMKQQQLAVTKQNKAATLGAKA